MQEIEDGIYYEDGFAGVTLGALTLSRGTILIDAPLRAEDSRSWRAALLNRGSGIDRILINLDSHPDRTIGARSLECTIVAHHKTAQVFRNRPTTFKGQGAENGAEWEMCSDLGSSRWAAPDLTFTRQLRLHWGTPQVILEHHPGPAPGAIWAVIPQARVAFIGDAVPLNQPPFLSNADLPAWIELLDLLQGPEYRTYVLISGRGGPVTAEDVRLLRKLLVDIEQQFTGLWAQNAPVEEIEALAPRMLSEFKIPAARRELYEQRLRYGLQRYYNRHYRPPEEFGEEPAE